MKIFVERGRLGNQLLQYYGVASSSRDQELKIFIGMKDLRTFLTKTNLPEINNSYFLPLCSNSFVLRLLNAFFGFLVRMKIVRAITENENGNLSNIENGIVFRNCFFQKQDTLFLNKRTYLFDQIVPRQNTYFLHVRRGDYAFWPSPDYSALLPPNFYKIGMQRIVANDPKAMFLVFSDDISWARDTFEGFSRCHFKDTNIEEAISLMCSCVGGILSPSSISLFAAHQIWSRNSNVDTLLFAPYFWAGFRASKWIPKVQFDWLSYLNVDFDE
jgi:hypothetical protein